MSKNIYYKKIFNCLFAAFCYNKKKKLDAIKNRAALTGDEIEKEKIKFTKIDIADDNLPKAGSVSV